MKKVIATIFIFLTMFIWSTSFLVMKNTLDYVSSGFLIFLRGIITFIVLLPFSIKHIKELNKKYIILIIISGMVVATGYIIQTIGLNYTTPAKNAFLEDAYCIVTPILTCIILKEKLSFKNLICILLCISGVIVISADSINGNFGIGEILSFLAGVCYGINIAITGIYVKDTNAITYTCGQFFIISLISGIYSMIAESNQLASINSNTILPILYLGLIVTAFAWILRNYAQQYLSPISVSLILPFSAVFGSILSVIAKEDTITINLIIGGILIMVSIILDTILDRIKEKQWTVS